VDLTRPAPALWNLYEGWLKATIYRKISVNPETLVNTHPGG
jgi:hypothetical protein